METNNVHFTALRNVYTNFQLMWRFARTGVSVAARSKACFLVPCPRRYVSKTINTSFQEFLSELAGKQPMFPICPSSIQILNQPSQFYERLLDMISKAERRIFISSLYIGSEETKLISALKRRLREKPDLQLKMVLDLNRSTRPGSGSTAKLLLPLLFEFRSRVSISMFRSPHLRGLMAKIVPPRFNEGWGTWHAKIYGVDDDVMISGANLNISYFTDRQDRYISFSGQTYLAQYCHDFMETVTPFSYQLLPKVDASSGNPNPYSYSSNDYTLRWPNSNIHPHYIHASIEEALTKFQNLQQERSKRLIQGAPETSSAQMALLVPLIQAGQFNIKEEESAIHSLFRKFAKTLDNHRPLLDLTSGYFSLYAPYQDLILNSSDIDCRIVAASPKANGFYGSKGISGRIPEGYTLYEKRFMAAVAKAGRLWNGPSETGGKGVLLSEWEKPGWTYHAKGIWLSLTSSTPPILTLFGSTNLNARSAHIDTELSFLMILPSETLTADPDLGSSAPPHLPICTLRQNLAFELSGIRSNAHKWQGGERKVRWTTQFIVWLVKGML